MDQEEELDSEKGFTSDEDAPECVNAEQEQEELKIQDCLLSFFDNIDKTTKDRQLSKSHVALSANTALGSKLQANSMVQPVSSTSQTSLALMSSH